MARLDISGRTKDMIMVNADTFSAFDYFYGSNGDRRYAPIEDVTDYYNRPPKGNRAQRRARAAKARKAKKK